MTFAAIIEQGFATIGIILATMAIVALIEVAIPLHARRRWNNDHLAPNLALTFLTFFTNMFLNAALLMAVAWLHANGYGLPRLLPLPAVIAAAIAVVILDFSYYVAHVAMHKSPGLWRFHRVHHSDPAVDVTTTIRQHPVESVIRYVFMGAFAIAIGPSPAAFAVYHAWSAINRLLEHANIRVPRWLDRVLALVTTWPNMHKVHHSRFANETDTNYGNLFSLFDRLFSTFTPPERGAAISYGLDGLDDPAMQTTAGLLALPFRDTAARASVAVAASGGQA